MALLVVPLHAFDMVAAASQASHSTASEGSGMSTQRVRFVEEPPPISGPQDPRAVWMERLRLLVERPGEWAEVYSNTPSACHQAANALRLRQYWIPPGGWDFTVRSFRRGHLSYERDNHVRAVIYARYNGPDADAWSSATAAWNHGADAIWDQYGRRLCPSCEKRPLILCNESPGSGSYPSMCDECSHAAAIPGVNHGTEAAYRHQGCRCPDCRQAAREAHRNRQNAKRLSMLGVRRESA